MKCSVLELPFACELNSVYVLAKKCDQVREREGREEAGIDKYLYDIVYFNSGHVAAFNMHLFDS